MSKKHSSKFFRAYFASPNKCRARSHPSRVPRSTAGRTSYATEVVTATGDTARWPSEIWRSKERPTASPCSPSRRTTDGFREAPRRRVSGPFEATRPERTSSHQVRRVPFRRGRTCPRMGATWADSTQNMPRRTYGAPRASDRIIGRTPVHLRRWTPSSGSCGGYSPGAPVPARGSSCSSASRRNQETRNSSPSR